jgi:hypothetical protein
MSNESLSPRDQYIFDLEINLDIQNNKRTIVGLEEQTKLLPNNILNSIKEKIKEKSDECLKCVYDIINDNDVYKKLTLYQLLDIFENNNIITAKEKLSYTIIIHTNAERIRKLIELLKRNNIKVYQNGTDEHNEYMKLSKGEKITIARTIMDEYDKIKSEKIQRKYLLYKAKYLALKKKLGK